MNIAVCDDEEIQRSLLKGYLEAWAEAGSHALCISLFSTGRQFLESLKKTHFDIVLLDIQMPGVSGIDLARRLLALCPHCQILFLTSHIAFCQDVYEVDHVAFVLKADMDTRLPAAVARTI